MSRRENRRSAARTNASSDDLLHACQTSLIANPVEQDRVTHRAAKVVAASERALAAQQCESTGEEDSPASEEEIRVKARRPPEHSAKENEPWPQCERTDAGADERPLSWGAAVVQVGACHGGQV